MEGATINGLGIVSLNKLQRYLDRLLYEMRNGKVEKGKIVLHKCNCALYLNRDHLSLGTAYERNLRSLVRKRNVKLNYDKASEIGNKYAKGKVFAKLLAANREWARMLSIALFRTELGYSINPISINRQLYILLRCSFP